MFCRKRMSFAYALLSAGAMLFAFSLATPCYGQSNVTPAQYLASLRKPRFASGHHLPHLSTASWPFSFETTVELATNWGYALDLAANGLANGKLERQLANAASAPARCIALCSNYPGKFVLQVYVDRDIPANVSDGFYVTNANGWFVDDNTNSWQYRTNSNYHPVVSPEAPDGDLAKTTDYWVSPLRTLASMAPIGIILNSGEYGLGVVGFNKNAWSFDPRVQAVMTNVWNYPKNTNGLSWPRYCSNRKAYHLGLLTSALRNAVPNRESYIFYNTGNEQSRFVRPGYPPWQDGSANWGWASDVMNTTTDLPSFQNYFVNCGSWTNATGAPWNQCTDLLTMHLNAVGFNIKLGKQNNYNWVSGGWSLTDPNRLADIPRYMGFLKCLYTSGMVGAAAGYFCYPTGTAPSIFGENGFTGTFPINIPPHWLLQIVALSRVHALFSGLENYLFSGDLLPGPNAHLWSTDQPSYEFPTGDPAARVLARKLRTVDQWLITAWAADGPDRYVNVTIPKLGQVQLLARSSGAVYQGSTPNLTLLDADGTLPTEAPAPPTDLRVLSDGN